MSSTPPSRSGVPRHDLARSSHRWQQGGCGPGCRRARTSPLRRRNRLTPQAHGRCRLPPDCRQVFAGPGVDRRQVGPVLAADLREAPADVRRCGQNVASAFDRAVTRAGCRLPGRLSRCRRAPASPPTEVPPPALANDPPAYDVGSGQTDRIDGAPGARVPPPCLPAREIDGCEIASRLASSLIKVTAQVNRRPGNCDRVDIRVRAQVRLQHRARGAVDGSKIGPILPSDAREFASGQDRRSCRGQREHRIACLRVPCLELTCGELERRKATARTPASHSAEVALHVERVPGDE